MPEVSIKEQLKKLLDLQTVDFEIYNLRRELREKPVYIENLRNIYEEKKAGLKALEDKLRGVLVERKAEELELQTKEGDIVKSNNQLFQLKTNKEYQAKMVEIENLKADKSIIEEKILLLYEETDKISAFSEKEKTFLKQEEEKYITQKKQVDDSIKGIQDRLSVLEAKRSQITPDILKTNLSRYERILENKDGLAMVPVKSDACGGCFMNVPAQVVNEIKMHDKLIFCEICSRILYLEDDL